MRSWTLGEFLKHEFPAPVWLVDKLLPGTGWALITAPAKTGKTVFCAQLAVALATGSTFLHWGIPAPKRVSFVEGDAPVEELQGQMEAVIGWTHQNNRAQLSVIDRALTGVQIVEPDGPILDRTAATKIVAQLRAHQPDLIIYDALESLTTGDINSLEAIRNVVGCLKNISEGKPFILIHHPRKRMQGAEGREDVRNSSAGHHFLTTNSSAAFALDADENGNGSLQFIKRRGASGIAFLQRRSLSEDAFVWVPSSTPETQDAEGRGPRNPGPPPDGSGLRTALEWPSRRPT